MRPHRRQPSRLPHPWDSPGKNTGVGCHCLLQCMKVKSESEVAQSCPSLATPWTAAHQAPPSMGFSRQKYWSGVPLPSPIKVTKSKIWYRTRSSGCGSTQDWGARFWASVVRSRLTHDPPKPSRWQRQRKGSHGCIYQLLTTKCKRQLLGCKGRKMEAPCDCM